MATKSRGEDTHPIVSILATYALFVAGSRPATSGSLKNGPKRCWYCRFEIIVVITLNKHSFVRNKDYLRRNFTILTQLVKAFSELDLIEQRLRVRLEAAQTDVNLVGDFVDLKSIAFHSFCENLTFLTFVAIVVICSPIRRSVAMHTHSSPVIASTVPPL